MTGEEVAQRDGDGWTPLHLAVWNMHYMTTIVLLESLAAEVNTANNNGWTAAHLAAWNDDLASLKLLIKAGADLNMCDMDE